MGKGATNAVGFIPSASVGISNLKSEVYGNSAPKMDGTASYGDSDKVSRENHVHPTDTSRAKTDLSNVSAGSVTRTMLNTDIYATYNPVMDGEASPGDLPGLSRSNHRHPTDTSRAAADLSNVQAGIISTTYTATLLADAWSSSGLPNYTQQTVDVPGLLTTDNFFVDARIGAVSGWSARQAMSDAFGLLYIASCSTDGQLSMSAREVPPVDIYLKITAIRK